MKKETLFIAFLFFYTGIFSQVGIGTTSPDASSVLDISASDKGILIPQVALGDVTDSMLDGTNVAATGLLIYNTNASTTGGSGAGYYYFNGTVWERLITTATAIEDADWYEESTTTKPDDINDDIYTMGNVAIGKITADAPIDISTQNDYGIKLEQNGTSNLRIYGLEIMNTNSGSLQHYGVASTLGGVGTGLQYGIYSVISNTSDSPHYGSFNLLNGSGSGTHYGNYNTLSGSGIGSQTGVYNYIQNTGDDTHAGVQNLITNNGNGPHLGVHSSIGGNGSGLHAGVNSVLTGAGTGIQYGVRNTLSNTGDNEHYGISNRLIGDGNGVHYGSYNQLQGNGIGTHTATMNILSGTGAGEQYGTNNSIYNSGDNSHYGVYSILSGIGSGNKYGTYVEIAGGAGGTHYGMYSNVLKAGSYAGYFLGNVSIGTTASNNYLLPSSRGTNGQVMQTDGAGNVNWANAMVDTDNQTIDQLSLSGTTMSISLEDDGAAPQTIDLSSLQLEDVDFYEEGTTSAPNDINDDIFHLGNLALGKNTADYKLDVSEDVGDRAVNIRISGNSNNNIMGSRIANTNTGTGTHHGEFIFLNGSGSGTHIGNEVQLTGNGDGNHFGAINIVNNNGNGVHYGSYNVLSGSGSNRHYGYWGYLEANGNGNQYGNYTIIDGPGTGVHFGEYIALSGSGDGTHNGSEIQLNGIGNGPQLGTINVINNSGNGLHYGNYNVIRGSGTNTHYGYWGRLEGNGTGVQIGLQNEVSNAGNASHYGVRNIMTGAGSGDKYGSFTQINSSAGGTHFGVYSEALKTGSFAGYFLGRISIGTTISNNYILPASRGTNGQVMQTDGSGLVNWVDPSVYWSRTGSILDVANAGDAIRFSSDQSSITFAASTAATPSPMVYMFSGGTSNTDRMVLAHSATFPTFGLQYDDTDDAFVFVGAGNPKVEVDLTGLTVLNVTGNVEVNGDIITDTATYPDYVFQKYYTGFSEINNHYDFKSLQEVELFIKENGHLPGVVSYAEVEQEGMKIDLSETAINNLEKIEELFLYAIEADKKIDTLSEENKQLKFQLENQQQEIIEAQQAEIDDLKNEIQQIKEMLQKH